MGDVPTQGGGAAVELLVLLGFGAGLWMLVQPASQTDHQQLGIQTTLEEQVVRAHQLIAQVTIIDNSINGGQSL